MIKGARSLIPSDLTNIALTFEIRSSVAKELTDVGIPLVGCDGIRSCTHTFILLNMHYNRHGVNGG